MRERGDENFDRWMRKHLNEQVSWHITLLGTSMEARRHVVVDDYFVIRHPEAGNGRGSDIPKGKQGPCRCWKIRTSCRLGGVKIKDPRSAQWEVLRWGRGVRQVRRKRQTALQLVNTFQDSVPCLTSCASAFDWEGGMEAECGFAS